MVGIGLGLRAGAEGAEVIEFGGHDAIPVVAVVDGHDVAGFEDAAHALDELSLAEIDVGHAAARGFRDFVGVGLRETFEVIGKFGELARGDVDFVELEQVHVGGVVGGGRESF